MKQHTLNRPTAEETEDDLLRLQEEYIRQSGSSQVKKDVVKVEHRPGVNRKRKLIKEPYRNEKEAHKGLDEHDMDITKIISNIKEVDISHRTLQPPFHETTNNHGFPRASDYKMDRSFTGKIWGGGKSLFAQQYDRKYNYTPKAMKSHMTSDESCLLTHLDEGERMEVERETNKIFGSMSEERKRAAAEEIFKNMDPKMVEFLKKRKKEAQEKKALQESINLSEKLRVMEEKMLVDVKEEAKSKNPMETEAKKSCCGAPGENYFLDPDREVVDLDGEKVELPLYVKPGEHLNMRHLEPDKLQWMSDLPKPSKVTTEDEAEWEVRFDFDGKIIPKGTEVHLDQGLHHHGLNPEEAGYTIEELFLLSRSAVSRQREIALLTLVHVTQRARHALYERQIKQNMLQLLLDSGIVQLYRHGLDTNQYEICLQGLTALLVSPTELVLQDCMYPDCNLYNLSPKERVTKDMDHDTVLFTDVVRLLAESQIPQRFWYLLTIENLKLSTIDNILNAVHHMVQHSLHVAMIFVRHEELLNTLVDLFLPLNLNHVMVCESSDCAKEHPLTPVIKTLRVLCGYGCDVSQKLLQKYDLKNRIQVYISLQADSFNEAKRGAIKKCQMEIAKLWGVLLQHGLGVDVYTSTYSLLVRELQLGGQRSVKLSTELVRSLTRGLHVISWDHVTCLYQPVILNVTTWCRSLKTESSVPPADDLLLFGVVLEFVTTYMSLHRTQHYDTTLAEQSSHLLDAIVRPVIFSGMLSRCLDLILYTKCFVKKATLQINSLPTWELHQYHRSTTTEADKLNLNMLSDNGEMLAQFVACCKFVRHVTHLLSTCLLVDRTVVEVVSGFIGNNSKQILNDLSRLRSYANSKLNTNIPDVIFNQVSLLQYQFITLASQVLPRHQGLVNKELLLQTSLHVLAELPHGYEYQQFQLLTLVLSHVNTNVTPLYIKKYEKVISRSRVLKSQRYWNIPPVDSRSQYLGSVSEYRSLTMAWVLFELGELRELPSEEHLQRYLEFVSYLCVEVPHVLSSVPTIVLLVRIMEVFLMSNQYFLSPKISEVLSKLLLYFADLPRIDVSLLSKNTSYSSFYDFYNTFCGVFEAEGFCDAVFGGFILLPMRADYAITYRRLVWLERPEVLRMLRRTAVSLARITSYPENDADMMSMYASYLASCPTPGVPQLLAVYHINNFLYNDKIKKEDQLLEVVRGFILKSPDNIKDKVARFKSFTDDNKLELYDVVPENRKINFFT